MEQDGSGGVVLDIPDTRATAQSLTFLITAQHAAAAPGPEDFPRRASPRDPGAEYGFNCRRDRLVSMHAGGPGTICTVAMQAIAPAAERPPDLQSTGSM